ncbi:hypothetical protein DBR40_18290 [Pedobacter sp. KBW01]|uniref:hypothetical protein n=1 Tax=Pedobacter sp. KBW01 TaxID=2153364 RepID=UPI000F5AE0B2|nr:hypothetical protein [Pedobacter sp. KBW01]RQO68936.1 hypothetical protein DBR40_18290 [Pedobacter sp. KBW01]
MKKIFFISLLFCGFVAQSQTSFKAWEAQINKDNCTAESVLKEPGRFWDAHIGGVTGGGKEGISSTEIANAKKMMEAFENITKPKLQFTGGLAKASFGLNSKIYYNQFSACSYTYNLGFHAFVCNVQTHKLAIVDEYQGVLRVNGNPSFQKAFNSFQGNADAYKIPANSPQVNAPFIAILNYYGFANSRVVNAINKGDGFIDLNSEQAGNLSPYPVIENKPGKGYGINFPNSGFVTVNNDFVYRHAFITHSDIPFFIPITRKKFLQDMLEYYDREKPELVANMQDRIKNLAKTIIESEKVQSRYLQDQKNKQVLQEQSARDILAVNEQKKQAVTRLLQSKDEKWLNQQAVVQPDNKSFTIPYNRNIDSKEIYGNFYFTEFYTGSEGFNLYQINPEYLKKYPPNGTKPALIDVMYRFKPNYIFLMGVKESFIDQLNLDEFRKLLQ